MADTSTQHQSAQDGGVDQQESVQLTSDIQPVAQELGPVSSPNKTAVGSERATSILDLDYAALKNIFRDTNSFDAFDLIKIETVCKSWHEVALGNDVWDKQLAPPAYNDEDIETLKQKSPTGCRDWWCLQEYDKRRQAHQETQQAQQAAAEAAPAAE